MPIYPSRPAIMISEAPSFRPSTRPRSNNFPEEDNHHLVDIPLLLTPNEHQQYPKLTLHPYYLNQQTTPSNVLAFVHNAAKREIADFVSVVIPALQRFATTTGHASAIDTEWEYFPTWWAMFLRIFFFVAETDDNIIRLTLEPAQRTLKKQGDLRRCSALAKSNKSIEDRYAFAMELVLKATDRAIDAYFENGDDALLDKAVEKMRHMVNFMLDVMDLTMDLLLEVEDVCDISLTNLEASIANSIFSFVKGSDRSIFITMATRWLAEESRIREWVVKYGGLRARWFFDSWQTAHHEARVMFINSLKSNYLN